MIEKKRFHVFPSFNGITNANHGFGIYDADKFGTGVPSIVGDAETMQEALAFVSEQGGIVVEHTNADVEVPTSSGDATETQFSLLPLKF